MEKRILGLDPGIAILGFGTILCQTSDCVERSALRNPLSIASSSANGKPLKLRFESAKVLDFGVIETSAKNHVGDRLKIIYEDLHALIEEIRPDLVAIEKLFFYRMSSLITVAQARGVLMLVLAQENLPYVEFTPAQVKQALTGYGNADKYEVQSAVARELCLESIPQPNDAADALALALTAWFYL